MSDIIEGGQQQSTWKEILHRFRLAIGVILFLAGILLAFLPDELNMQGTPREMLR